MAARVRISSSPPNIHEEADGEASYYCDIAEIDDWPSYAVVAQQAQALIVSIRERTLRGYIAYGPFDKEIGIVICYEDEEDELMYCAIDCSGRARCEPAVNEALWHVANTAAAFPRGHRLKRDPRGTSKPV